MWCWGSPQIGRIRAATTSATQERLTFLVAKLVLQDERTGNPMFIMMAKSRKDGQLVGFSNNLSLPQFFEKVRHIIQIDIPAPSGDPVAGN